MMDIQTAALRVQQPRAQQLAVATGAQTILFCATVMVLGQSAQ